MFKWAKTKNKILLKLAAVICTVISLAVFTYVGKISLTYLFKFAGPEKVVIKYDMKMVVQKGFFYQGESYYFYEYKNSLFYGKKLGYESYYYGAKKPSSWYFYDLDGNLIDASEYFLEKFGIEGGEEVMETDSNIGKK